MKVDVLFALGSILLFGILALSGVMHVLNLKRVHRMIEAMENCNVTNDALYKELSVSQGSNFCGLALAAWVMLFVAIAYLYLLVPTVLPFSYMQIPSMVSNPAGFAIFGLAIAALVIVVILGLDMLPEKYREFKLLELYSFYAVSRSMKRLIALTIIILSISVVISAYIGTIYPVRSQVSELVGLFLLVASAGLLTAPVFGEALGGRA